MAVRRNVSAIVGLFQEGVGVLAIIFAFFFYYNLFNFRDSLGLSPGDIPVCLFLLFVFGSLSIISGALLIQEWRKST